MSAVQDTYLHRHGQGDLPLSPDCGVSPLKIPNFWGNDFPREQPFSASVPWHIGMLRMVHWWATRHWGHVLVGPIERGQPHQLHSLPYQVSRNSGCLASFGALSECLETKKAGTGCPGESRPEGRKGQPSPPAPACQQTPARDLLSCLIEVLKLSSQGNARPS